MLNTNLYFDFDFVPHPNRNQLEAQPKYHTFSEKFSKQNAVLIVIQRLPLKISEIRV